MTNSKIFGHAKQVFAVILAIVVLLSLVSCSRNRISEQLSDYISPDLSGQWKQINSNSSDSYHGAIISDNTIEIYWVADDYRALYWSGSFVAPDSAEEPYSWTSESNIDQTGTGLFTALFASTEETKTFTYENSQISYSVTMMGVTSTIRLEKQEWEPNLEINTN